MYLGFHGYINYHCYCGYTMDPNKRIIAVQVLVQLPHENDVVTTLTILDPSWSHVD
jgi:hypothetical protein